MPYRSHQLKNWRMRKLCMATQFISGALLCLSTHAALGSDYLSDIKPLLAEKCTACHGAVKQEAGLRLDHGSFVRLGSDSGSVIDEQNNPNTILHRIASTDDSQRMPPPGEGSQLTPEHIAIVREWINEGASSPDDEDMPVSPSDHWAWQRPQRRQAAAGIPDAWKRNPVDALLYTEMAAKGLRPNPPAGKSARLRRLHFDLTGLPPTPEQLRHFEGSPTQWAAEVDQLLLSPTYGERWARHWMDVWRYSDWDGYKNELRGSQRHIWRWRDWIIESLNNDKGYDLMILEMLAGDEVAAENSSTLRATGFLARNFHKSNRDIWLDATVEHTAKAFLATTLNCARCHDHKYDPLSQREYYAFRAVFEPHRVRTDRIPGQPDIAHDGLVRAYDADLEAPTYLYLAGNEKTPDKEQPVAAAPPQLFTLPFQANEVNLPSSAHFPSLRRFEVAEDIAALEKALADAKAEEVTLRQTENSTDALALEIASQTVVTAKAELGSLRDRQTADQIVYADNLPTNHAGNEGNTARPARVAAIMSEHIAALESAKLDALKQRRLLAASHVASEEAADPAKKSEATKARQAAQVAFDKAEEAVTKAQEKLDELQSQLACESDLPNAEYTPTGTAYPRKSTGRRLALARWITHNKNPLTARVAVNYVWMHLMGQPLVDNVFDFGMRSPAPPQQAVLDLLACELIDSGWSLKHIIRIVAMSNAYQMDSSPNIIPNRHINAQLDPDNRFFWRANARRHDAEAIRDSLLHVGGTLQQTFGGADIAFTKGETSPRRSVYFQHAYEKQMQILVLFDAAAPTECYQRSESVIPQQALALANSPLATDQARLLARRLWPMTSAPAHEADSTAIREAFATLFARPCTEEELAICHDFLDRQTATLAYSQNLTSVAGELEASISPSPNAWLRARENLIQTLVNHNDFVTLR